MWICHTLRNELLGAASVSLGSLLKGGGKRTYQGCGHRTRAAGTGAVPAQARGRGGRGGCCWPCREQGAVVCPGPGVPEAVPASARLGNTNPSAIPLLFAAVCGCQSVARDSSSHIKAAIQGWGWKRPALSLPSKACETQTWY